MKLNANKKQRVKQVLYKIFVGDTVPRKIFLFYLYAILVGVILLSLPISLKDIDHYVKYDGNGNSSSYTFIDILFTSISAFSDTGLSTMNIFETYNIFGQLVILLLAQVGGLGLFTIYWVFWNWVYNSYFYKKKHGIDMIRGNSTMGFSNHLLLASERGHTKLGLTKDSIKNAIIFIFIVEGIFWVIYSIFFGTYEAYNQVTLLDQNHIQDPLYSDYVGMLIDDKSSPLASYHSPLAIWTGLFHSVSSINNAGLDVISNASLEPYRNGGGTILLFLTTIQIFIGGIGYPVIHDILSKIRSKRRNEVFKISNFTKICLISYFTIFFIGFFFILGFEFGFKSGIFHKITFLDSKLNFSDAEKEKISNYFGKERDWNIFSNLYFSTFTTRSAGFSSISQSTLSDASKWVVIILMYIGASPSSTGGGIRVTALAIIFIYIVSKIRGLKQTIIFEKSISKDLVIEAFMVSFLALFFIITLSLISYPIWQSNSLSMTDFFFEFSSAFGTTGLSSGLLSQTFNDTNSAKTIITCLLLCVIMIIGQLGISGTLVSFRKDLIKNNKISYPIEDIRL